MKLTIIDYRNNKTSEKELVKILNRHNAEVTDYCEEKQKVFVITPSEWELRNLKNEINKNKNFSYDIQKGD